MKKIVYLLVFVLTIVGINKTIAQEDNTLNVVGRAQFDRTVSAYKARIVLSMDQMYYSNPECEDLESFKDKYFTLLKGKGINPEKFIENELAYTSYSYQKSGTVYDYETQSFEEIEVLSSNKMNGVQVTIQYKTIVTDDQKELFLKKALQDAQKNAELLSTLAGKKIKGIKSVSETSLNTELWNGYYNDLKEYITVYVTYEMD